MDRNKNGYHSLMRRGSFAAWVFAAILVLEGFVAALPHVHTHEVVHTSCGASRHDHTASLVAVVAVEHGPECLACTSHVPASVPARAFGSLPAPAPSSSAPVLLPPAPSRSGDLAACPRGPPVV